LLIIYPIQRLKYWIILQKITGIRPTFYQIDVTDYKKIKKFFLFHTIDAVIHLAGYKSVGESTKDPLKYYTNNIGGLTTVLTCMNETRVKKIIFSSTAVVYGNPEVLPLIEDSKINLLNPYAQSKYTSEIIVKDASKAYDLSVVILRYFNPVGDMLPDY
jgi:UDP-glucose 4-epimerase